MFFYILSIFWCFFSFIFKRLRTSSRWYLLTMSMLCVFLCFGYMTGSDWRSYEPMYDNVSIDNLFYDYYWEPGYYIWMLLFKVFHLNFWFFFITTKVLVFLAFLHTINKYSLEYRYLIWTFFLPFFAFYLFIDNPMRNLIAVAISLYAFNYLIRRKFVMFLIVTLLALSFHVTAIVLIPLYFLLLKHISTKVYLILLLCLMIFFSNDFIINLLGNITGIDYINQKMLAYADSEDGSGQSFSIKMFINLSFFLLLLWKRDKIEAYPNGLFLLNSSLFFVLFYRIGLGMHILYRFQLYFCLPYSICVILLIRIFTKRSHFIFATYLLFLSLACSMAVRTWKYIPYTNYLCYIYDSLSFSYRDSYNIKNTPYPNTIK